jgi:Lipocalin-like domain
MLKFIVVVAGLLCSAACAAYSEEDLLGTWKLLGGSRKDVNTGEVTEAFGGPHPVGFISYGKDHRMMTVAAYDHRIKPERVDLASPEQRAQLFSTMFAYAGTFTVSGNTVQHHVETSWNETWTGTTVTRDISFQDGKLVLTTRPQLSLDGKTVY